MIDTVVVKFQTEPTEENLPHGWAKSTHTDLERGEVREKYIRNVDPFKATYYPIDHKGRPLLTIEFSLPKVLYGVNWPMLADIGAAVTKADEMLAADPGFPPLPSAGGAEIVRLDACYNHQVGDSLHGYLQALSRLEYRARQTVPFLGTGVEYRCLSGKTKFYDKRRETVELYKTDLAAWAPPGTLRQETTFRHTRDVTQALRWVGRPTLNALQPTNVLDILYRDLQHLGILDCRFATREVALQILCGEYGNNKGIPSTVPCARSRTA